ncbi:RagB/SusD family nutrient uptake outer membrane protein [Sphingobacterium oryzagri]|uniref:RagB/SusD family nutrient uptake outer membrane protein n=1 Tax=Sphingobacterium oryzagri TaxID=3025669 RepID=A0ABY7WI31_9SPHI|nr:RagB/SusD family nutrient uptake outer membrane protein [Sphingobacterium sp. KACC 22765]WDF69277.1 RagB/SusD family nutrient uptake outer membrane protein [Sphingobacterium sp. KACC 22765]
MKKNIFTLGIASAIFLLGGCSKDYLETSPTDKVSQEEIFSSIENANTAVNGIYRFMFQRTNVVTANVQNKPGVTGILLGIDFMGEDIGISAANWYTSTGEGNWQAARNDNHNVNEYYYRTFYKIIGDANFILDNIDGVNATDDQKNTLKAQALVLRAYAYSYLVQLYAKRYDRTLGDNNQLGVPLVLSSSDGALPRSTVSEVYASIVQDLDDAIALNITARSNKSQVNLHVAWGLRARVALTMQDYENAILFAKNVIDAGVFPLMNQENYQRGFNDATVLTEFIWATMPTQDQDDAFGSYFAQIAYNANTSFMRANPKRINADLYNKISATDVRKRMWEPAPTAANFPLPLTSFARQAYMSRKFSVKAAGGALGDVPLMRTSEMYLILAEAYASSSQFALAQDALFALVRVRDLSAVKTTLTGAQLLNEIWINRRVELWGEGFRYLDLKRLNQPLDRSVVPNYVGSSVNNFMTLPAGDVQWQFLFPRAELDANAQIVQND